MARRRRFIWADKIALLMVLFIAGSAVLFWAVGVVGLEGRPHPRLDSAMIDWTINAELMLVPPIWLFLRVVDFSARALGRLLRSSLGRISGGLRIPAYRGGEIVGA